MCLDTADKAGKLLARVLMSGVHDDRHSTIS